MFGEHVQIPLTGGLVLGPDGRFLAGKHHLVRGVRRRVLPPDVVVAVGVVHGLARLDEPRVPVGGVVDDEVRDHPDAAVVGGADEFHQVPQASEPGIHAVHVGDVVAVVAVRGRVEGHEPDARDAESGKIVHPLDQSAEISGAVAIAVDERLRIQAVNHRVLPPEVRGLGDSHSAPSVPAGACPAAGRSWGRTCSAKVWPCRADDGSIWSEHMAASKPACPAS
ncbi:hypothetical protein SRABI128_02803 [Microbacterium sp. Bi128]|nr:hypothetical protein SRABI128_02803 [Microbacterium sp. Bi128]